MKTSKDMNNREIAKLLYEVAAAHEVKGENRFKIVAYENAAASIERYPNEMRQIWQEGKLDEVPGVGKSIAAYLAELFTTGKVKHFLSITNNLPAGMFPLLEVGGIGPKTAYTLAKKLGITKENGAVSKLKKAALNKQIEAIENFGVESQNKILEAIAAWERKEDRILLPVAENLADKIVAYMSKCPAAARIETLGSLRRKVPTVGDIDLAVATDNPKTVIDHFLKLGEWREVLASGENTARAVHVSGYQVDLKTEPEASFGSMLQHFTGSKEHNVALRALALKQEMSLSEHGIKMLKGPTLGSQGRTLKQFSTEEEFYKYLGMKWIPPELRENRGEIEAALRQTQGKLGLPKLLEISQIKGDFHIHSDFNIEPGHDLGSSGLTEIVAAAEKLGYEYIAITDHNPSIGKHSKDQAIDLVKRRNEYIDKFIDSRGKNMKIRIFKSLEIDILPDGKLSFPDEGLELLDFAIASVHSDFSQQADRQTDRVIRALTHPKVKIFGHPTGRQLLAREGISYSWDRLFDFCLKNKICLEVNASPQRQDLPDELIFEAVKQGVKLSLGTDSHAHDQMDGMIYGVGNARRGWAEAGDVINSLGYNEVRGRLTDKKANRL